MKTKLFSILILTALFLFIFPTVVSAQYDWTDASPDPVLSWGETDEWDDGQVWNPSVIKDGDTLKMWYTGGNDIVWGEPITKLGYAWSLDGINWTKHPSNPVLSPKFGWNLFGSAVIKSEDLYELWYRESQSTSTRIGYAISENGIDWTKKTFSALTAGPEGEWDETHITPQTVIKTGENYKMWYWAGKPGFPYKESMPQSGLATSTDGINWTKYDDPTTTEAPFAFSDPVLKHGDANIGIWDEHRAISPMVIQKGSGYEMWYAGASYDESAFLIGYAKSADGIHWTKHPDPVYGSPSWGNTNYGGTVLAFDNKYHLWYALFHSKGDENQARPRVGYATSANPDGIATQSMVTNIQLYPNPFSSSTIISYELQHPSTMQITIYNHLGEQVEVIQQNQSHGKQQFVWNAEGLPAGIYFCVLQSEYGTQTTKVIKMK